MGTHPIFESDFDCLTDFCKMVEKVLFKLLLVGESAVGKSSILLRYMDGKFEESYTNTIGVDFKVKKVQRQNTDVTLQLWDTAGQERFRTITGTFYHGAHGVVVVFDLGSRESFEAIRTWLSEIRNYCDDIPRILVGNKSDLAHREVSASEGREMAQRYSLDYMETSAKNNSGISETFDRLTDIILTRRSQAARQAEIQSQNNQNIRVQKDRKKKKKKSPKCTLL